MAGQDPIRVAVLDDYQRAAAGLADWAGLGPGIAVDFLHEPVPRAEAAARLAPYAVLCLMRERMPLDAALIEALPNLRLVVFTGGRTHALDFPALARAGVTVCHTRNGEGGVATAELAFALILACLRHLPGEFARMRAGLWQDSIGSVLDGRRLGLVGLGRIGGRMARIGAAFGMEPVAWSPHLTPERAAAGGAALVSREDLFRTADVVSLHLVLAPATRGIVGAAEIGLMRPGAVLINTARGPLVDEAALIAALREGRLRAAGLDVFDREPLPADHPLRALPNAVLTPHLGYVTDATYRMFYEDTVEAIAAWRRGAPVRVVEPAA
ncbi:D-isomer specific 2-hydroxyacid dehydrogenase NAD-binding [Methylobacterium sp. 4-46]|uniref:D-2-hydroxyacid dehydrogenase family protein n=1 Tax=unclassified Methylobacterium TaxID=2615210 RepID=UPI000165C619|nr:MULTISPECIES: D-2-hydroxyacid dehydrogenase family protein [Methylobacterium]ACA14896.1 D-isomer specific 2-hydroxyacid dehydrogenase NAD-binding [Methylobacterium sp. 4-46]WFT80636.1 D-2-hydroxyacid dehydrogenase family protein [Methylobacterium nodulans]